MSLFRPLFRASWFYTRAHLFACAAFVGVSFTGTDAFFEQHWEASLPVTTRGNESWIRRAIYSPSMRLLEDEEKECLDAWLSVMRFDVERKSAVIAKPDDNTNSSSSTTSSTSSSSPSALVRTCKDTLFTRRFAPSCFLNDSLIFFNGLTEIADGFWFMSLFYDSSEAVVTELRREVQGETVFLHAKTSVDAKVRFVPLTYTFRSAVTLELSRESGNNAAESAVQRLAAVIGKKPLRIVNVEHRWFEGPIVSKFTSTYDSAWGDVGDLFRRVNGFFLSSVITNSEFLN